VVEDINYIKSKIENLIKNLTEEEIEQLIISYLDNKEKSN